MKKISWALADDLKVYKKDDIISMTCNLKSLEFSRILLRDHFTKRPHFGSPLSGLLIQCRLYI
jgi:hypothetical protein